MNTTFLETTLDIPAPTAGRRRRFTVAEKRRFLAEASRPGETVSSVGRRYGLSVSLLFRWRRQIDGIDARRTANRTLPVRQDIVEVAALQARVADLEHQVAQKNQELEALRRRVAGRAESVEADGPGLGAPRAVGTVACDGEA